MNDGNFVAKVADLLLARLSKHAEDHPRAELDGNSTRGRVLFQGGTVYDFKTATWWWAQPSDRMGYTANCHYQPCTGPPEILDLAKSVFADILAFFKAGGRSFGESNEGRRIIDGLEQLREHLDLLQVMWAFCGDWDTIIYLLRFATRCMAGESRFCEFLYIWGCGKTGKDVFMGILTKWFGSGLYNLGLVMPGQWITEGKPPKEGASPFLANTRGRRAVWLSEVPEHKQVHQDLIKAFCEQGGAPITTRKLYRAPETFRPIGGLFCTSNYVLTTQTPEDDGFQRRARVLETRYKFVPHPTTLTERKADDLLKGRIDAGAFDGQLFLLATLLYDTLDPEVSPGTELQPRPEHMAEGEEEVFAKTDSAEAMREWLIKCTPVARVSGVSMTTFRKALEEAIEIKGARLRAAAKKVGLDLKGMPNAENVRVVVWKHPDAKRGHDSLQLPSASGSSWTRF